RQAEALEAYQSARAALVDELGIEPTRALQALEGSILRQDAGLDLKREESAPERSVVGTPPEPTPLPSKLPAPHGPTSPPAPAKRRMRQYAAAVAFVVVAILAVSV